MKEIILIGGGGHCKSVIDVIEQESVFQIAGIVDKPEFLGTEVLGYQVVGNDADLSDLASIHKYALITLGHIKNPKFRIKLFELALNAGFKFPIIRSPFSYVSKHAVIEAGTIIMHDALVNANAKVGRNTIINSRALIEHDCDVGDNCHISTNSVLNGGTSVGEGSFIGSGTVTKEGVSIGPNSFIKAGSLVK
jgi:sugar O-acyltransferase (sialic acid O-acetyltransferase NeuD family)